jgi:hypothetical protein
VRLLLALALLLVATPAVADRWKLEIPERIELTAQAGGALPIAVQLEPGLRVSKDAGIIVDLAPDAAIGVKRRRLGRTDAVDPDADAPRYSIALRADTPGDFTIRVRLRFWVCGSKVCRPADARRNVAVRVAAPAGTP